MLIPLAGFLAGMQHVVAGPDHLAAVAPLAVADRRAAWRGGLTWALGHSGGVALVALVAVGLRELSPINAELLSGWSERLVGIMLVGIGLWGLRKTFSSRLHAHVHEHDGQRHVHMHVHDQREAHPPETPAPHHHHSHAALAVGTLHGLAGGSHFLGVLPALALDAPSAVLYIAAYGVGTISAMVLFAATLGSMAVAAGRGGMRWTQGLMAASSIAAIVVGGYWITAAFPHAS